VAKKVDITEKLELAGNPYLVIAGHELEVNADAATMLTIMDTRMSWQNSRNVLSIPLLIIPVILW
jgi:hypothetical protein